MRLLADRLLSAGAPRRKIWPEIALRDLTHRFSYDCLWRAEARSKAGKSACGVTCQTSQIHVPLTCRPVS
jgi:hypothetical protein